MAHNNTKYSLCAEQIITPGHWIQYQPCTHSVLFLNSLGSILAEQLALKCHISQ